MKFPLPFISAVLLPFLGAFDNLAAQESLAQEKSVRLQVREAKLDPVVVKTAFTVSLAITRAGVAAPTKVVDGKELVVLKKGERFAVEIRSERSGFVRVFYHNAKGDLIQLLPNQFAKEGFVKAGEPLFIGGPNDGYEIEVEPPLGAECLAVLVSTLPFTDENQVATLLKDRAFIEVAATDVTNAGIAVTKSVKLVPKEAAIGAALLHVETE